MQLQPHRIMSKTGGSLLVASAILLLTRPAIAGDRANYVEVAAWDTGYQAQYTITNDGPGTLTTWTVAFDLPSGSTISSSWDSVHAGSAPHPIFNNATWNGELPPGGSTSFGFVVVGLGRPAGCTINGTPCDTLAPLQPAIPAIRNDSLFGGIAWHGYGGDVTQQTTESTHAIPRIR